MPFKKGISGNPKGKPNGAEGKQRIARNLLEHLLPRAAEVYEEMLNEKSNKGFAAKEIFDRCCGKPAQSVEVTGKDGGPLRAVIEDA